MSLGIRSRFVLLACLILLAWAPLIAAGEGDATDHRLDSEILKMCTGKYAICDAALCTPIAAQKGPPGSKSVQPTTAICECGVVEGPNLGPGPCKNRKPRGPNNEYIMSTYSYALKNLY